MTAGAGTGKTRTLGGTLPVLAGRGHPSPFDRGDHLHQESGTRKCATACGTRSAATSNGRICPLANAGAGRHSTPSWTRRASTPSTACAPRSCAPTLPRPGSIRGSPSLDEGPAALLRAQVLDETLAWAANDPAGGGFVRGTRGARPAQAAASALLEKRPDAEAALAAPGDDPLAYWERLLSVRIRRLLVASGCRSGQTAPPAQGGLHYVPRRVTPSSRASAMPSTSTTWRSAPWHLLRARPDVLVTLAGRGAGNPGRRVPGHQWPPTRPGAPAER